MRFRSRWEPSGCRRCFCTAIRPASRELHQLAEFVDEKLEAAIARMGLRWDRVIATSATAAAVVCAVNRVSRSRRDQADRLRASTAQIRKLFQQLATLDLAGRRKIAGIGPRRAEIIVAGAGALLRILERFHAACRVLFGAGVRDGIIADMASKGVGGELARLSREQRREVERVATRFGADPGARPPRRRILAVACSRASSRCINLPLSYGRLLEAACYFCETGHYINDSAHHKHAYYIVSNVDLSGFTNREREFIANLCRYHRKAMPSPSHPEYQTLAANGEASDDAADSGAAAGRQSGSRPEEVELVSCEIQNCARAGEVEIAARTGSRRVGGFAGVGRVHAGLRKEPSW